MNIPTRITIRLTSRQRMMLAEASREIDVAYPELAPITVSAVIDCAIDCLAEALAKGTGLPNILSKLSSSTGERG